MPAGNIAVLEQGARIEQQVRLQAPFGIGEQA